MKIFIFSCLLCSLTILFPIVSEAYTYERQIIEAPTAPPSIIFPVKEVVNFSDDFGGARSGHRLHQANDLMAPKMTHILAARGGRIISAPTTEPSYGYTLSILGDDGYTYNYLHINNDTPGTDDGLGGVTNAYAPGISRGVIVVQGQHIAYVGDSGNAESTAPHLHFEIRLPDGTAINPYPHPKAALNTSSYSPEKATTDSPNINYDKGLSVISETNIFCEAGSLIKTESNSSVYYCGADGKRYVFPNLQTYSTWYADFSSVKTISSEALAKIMLGGNVTYRPGVKLVKITTDPRVYAVDIQGTLRLLITPQIAEKYYGVNWNKKVEDVPDVFFFDYKVGISITS